MDKLARDVFVNVVANIIAAAVLYLLAVAAGALPDNDGLQLVASTSIVGLLGGWAVVAGARKIGRERLGAVALFVPLGAYIGLRGAVFPQIGQPWLLGAGYVVAGVLILALGLGLALRYDQRGRHAERKGGPWSWGT